MKKIFTLVALAGATALSASAQVLTPVPVELKNPSFEYSSLEGDETRAVKGVVVAPESGWKTAESNVEFSYCNYSNAEVASGNKAAGAFYVRALALSGDMDATSCIYQDLVGPGPGTYVLSASVCATRDYDGKTGNRRGVLTGVYPTDKRWQPNYGVLYVADENSVDILYGEPGCAAIEDMGNYSPRVYVVLHSESPIPQLQVGFRWAAPEGVKGVSKGWLSCDDFQLEYYPETADMNPEEAIAAVSTQVKATVAASMAEAKKIASKQEIGKVYKKEELVAEEPMKGFGKLAYFGNAFREDLLEDVALLEEIYETGEIPVTPPSGVEDIIASPVQDDNRYFNLQGIEVAEPTQPGLYIHNGKKILVK